MEKVTTTIKFKTDTEVQAFKEGYEVSLLSIVTLAAEVKRQEVVIQHQAATIQRLKATEHHHYITPHKRQA